MLAHAYPDSLKISLLALTHGQMLLPAPVHIMHIEISQEMAWDIPPRPLWVILVLEGYLVIQVLDLIIIPMAELLQAVLGLSGCHPYVKHEIDPRHTTELGLP